MPRFSQPVHAPCRHFEGARVVATAGLLLSALVFSSSTAASYDYPVQDALLATVIGTRAADEGPVPKKVPTKVRSIVRFPERDIPDVFWNQDEFRYTVSAQKKGAPLIFIVAGTGASHRSSKMLYLRRLFFSEGFHVIALSSPTHPNFILTASSSGHPGYTPEDSLDLYAVMREAYSELASKVSIHEVHLTGYSLGGTQAAFLTAIDDREGAFHFKKILMINPSVDLFASLRILDGLFSDALPDGAESVVDLVERLLAGVSAYSQEHGLRSLDDELLYKIAEERIAEGRPPKKRFLAGLIAASFRLSASDMFFTVDVLANGGHIVPKDTKLGVGASLEPYFRRSMSWSFERYFDDVLLPYWQNRGVDLDLDREALIERASLRSLAVLLREDSRMGAVTNADDIILSAEDLEFLRTNMGDRLKVYPVGGHCGNLSYRENSEYMIRYFKEDTP